MKVALITGVGGLVGSECARTLSNDSTFHTVGIDSDKRKYFFGNDASTLPVIHDLQKHHNIDFKNCDITNMDAMTEIFDTYGDSIEIIIHTAAQPSHDWAAQEPLTDFAINATATVSLLELYRRHCPRASFIFTSTNKVYGNTPNALHLVEFDKRYDRCNKEHSFYGSHGVTELMSIDHSTHSVFGASKVAADIMVQEYGRYFDLNTVTFRCGCLTGSHHMGTKLHGFLSYLIKCIVHNKHYTIYGYKGKQVRDNLHSQDLVRAFLAYHTAPKAGAVYNIGGGHENSVSILEAIDYINSVAKTNWSNYTVDDTPRKGDHQWYVTNNERFQHDYGWTPQVGLEDIITEMVLAEKDKH